MGQQENIISFICCVNNDVLFGYAKDFINDLVLPDGYSIEIIDIRNARSITSGYNEGMKKAKGKIKVYLHQDVYLIHPFLIRDILKIFEDNKIGMIGVIGSKEVPANYVWWEAQTKFGETYEIRNTHMFKRQFQQPYEKYEEVALLDGLLMITQYDIPWREDILDGWHFYDCSQCLEFSEKELKVVVPYQKKPWTIHDCGYVSTYKYEWYQKIIMAEYSYHNLIK